MSSARVEIQQLSSPIVPQPLLLHLEDPPEGIVYTLWNICCHVNLYCMNFLPGHNFAPDIFHHFLMAPVSFLPLVTESDLKKKKIEICSGCILWIYRGISINKNLNNQESEFRMLPLQLRPAERMKQKGRAFSSKT